MNQTKHDVRSNPFNIKSPLPQAILGLLVGGIVGLIVGFKVAPPLIRLLVKPSIFIPDFKVMFADLLIMGLGAFGGAIAGMLTAMWLARRFR